MNSTSPTVLIGIPDIDVSKHGYFGFDIGGSLCKICFYEPKGDVKIKKLIEFINNSTTYGSTGLRDAQLSLKTKLGRFHFILFETRRMENAVQLILNADLLADLDKERRRVAITGGGAHKFSYLFENRDSLNVELVKLDEMKSLVNGVTFLLTHVVDECFFYPMLPSPPSNYDDLQIPERQYIDLKSKKDLFPYMLVNVGSGVSFLKVNADGSYERISGSGVGGGTYWGLARLLTKAKSFDETLNMCQTGRSKNVDMTVGDIYGGDYASLGLPADMTASFFGKFSAREESNLRDNVSDNDVCRGLLLMITNNIGQIAFLLAKLHKINHILFSGSFLRHSSNVHIAPAALSRAFSFWSNGEMKALFLKHEGYFGALGAFLSQSSP